MYMRKMLVILSLLFLGSCACKIDSDFERAQESKQAYEVVNHNGDPVIIETLSTTHITKRGVYKITVDSSEYVLVIVGPTARPVMVKHK